MYYAIFAIGIVHVCSGISIAISPRSALVTPLAEFLSLAGAATAPILIIVGFIAIASNFVPDFFRLPLIVPQQAVLTIQLCSLILTLSNGYYPDGYIPNTDWPRLFIFNDQIWAIFCCVFHTWEVLLIANETGSGKIQ
jgi:hypothetical protein